MKRLLTVTLSALFLVLLISTASVDSYAYDNFTPPPYEQYINVGDSYLFIKSYNPTYQYYQYELIVTTYPLVKITNSEGDFLKSVNPNNRLRHYKCNNFNNVIPTSYMLYVDNVYTTDNLLFNMATTTHINYQILSGNYSVNSYYDYIQEIELSDEYLYITTPREGYKTIDKFIKYTINYSIAAASANDLTIQVRNQDNIPLDDDPMVKSYYIDSQTATQEGAYSTGILSVMVEYENIVGAVGLTATVKNNVTNRQLQLERNCELVAFIDSNQDGIDDNTGQDQYVRPDITDIDGGKPKRSDYSNDIWGEIQFGFDTLVYYLTLPFAYIAEALGFIVNWFNDSVGWITSISNLFSAIFGFLPAEVTSAMTVLILVIVIFSIFKIVRG